MRLRVERDDPHSRRPWRVIRPENCHDYCFRYVGAFQTWEQAVRYAMAMAYGD